jgi:hypothetical protein
MQKGFRFAVLIAVVMVAGCAGGTTTPRDSTVVTVSAYGPDISGQHEHGIGARLDVRETGEATSLAYPPMELRECNQSKTSCALGIGVIGGTAEIVSTNATSATLAIHLSYQVGRSYSFNANGQQFKQQVPPDVQALQANQVISKHIEVAYGEVVHLPLQYGVDVAVCAQKHAAGEIMPDRSVCKGY